MFAWVLWLFEPSASKVSGPALIWLLGPQVTSNALETSAIVMIKQIKSLLAGKSLHWRVCIYQWHLSEMISKLFADELSRNYSSTSLYICIYIISMWSSHEIRGAIATASTQCKRFPRVMQPLLLAAYTGDHRARSALVSLPDPAPWTLVSACWVQEPAEWLC